MRSTMPRFLLIGDSGQVGWELKRTLATLGEVITVGRNTSPLKIDLTDLGSIKPLVHEVKPKWIVNAAAYTAVDQAESEEDIALVVNGKAPGVLAELAREIGSVLVHYSTDYVFDGQSQMPYSEDASTNPINAYGRTKLAGEQAIQSIGGQYLILRTSWVYGLRGKNFLLTIQRLAREREELRIVVDQIGSPTWCRNIAEATAQIASQVLRCPELMDEATGLYHLTSAGEISWHGFAEAIFGSMVDKEKLKVKSITAIDTYSYPLPAERPQYSVLSNKKVKEVFGVYMPNWEYAIGLCMNG